ncbi:MAG: EAL domain-containing protein [Alcanivorax sp.]
MDNKSHMRHEEENSAAFGDVIPAFLAPNYIKQQYYAQEEIENPDTDREGNVEFLGEATQPKQRTDDALIRERLYDAIEHNDIDVFIQPIITLPQRKTKFYELYGRLRIHAGVYLAAEDYLPLAANEPMINHLDALLLSHCIKILSRQRRINDHDIGYFINVKPSTLRNRHFMYNLLKLLDYNRSIAHALIFEIDYNNFMMLSPGEQKIFKGLKDLGCRFSLDHVPEIPTDVKHLHQKQINFVKIAAKTFLKSGHTDAGFSENLSRKHNLEVNGTDIIVEKIENHRTLLQILDYDIKYGQGFLFGKPDFQGVYTYGD